MFSIHSDAEGGASSNSVGPMGYPKAVGSNHAPQRDAMDVEQVLVMKFGEHRWKSFSEIVDNESGYVGKVRQQKNQSK